MWYKCGHEVNVLLQEAKEDAEMDAEIALEMAMESQRRLSTTSNHSSVGGTYVGPCPESPGQVGRQHPGTAVQDDTIHCSTQ